MKAHYTPYINSSPVIWILTILLSLLTIPIYAQFQWTAHGVRVAPSTASLVNLSMTSDENGGAVIVYEHNPAGDSDIYAQWISGDGTLQWDTNGVPISTDAGNQKNPAVASDGAGGSYIAWHDEATGKIKIQRINQSQTLLWPSAITVCTATGKQSFVKMIADEQGNTILVWKDDRNKITNGTDLFAQRIDGNGTRLWINAGVPVSEAAGDQTKHVMHFDGNGAYIVWQDYRSSGSNGTDIYAQYITPQAGTRQWNNGGSYEGIPVSTASSDQASPSVDLSGSNLVISWHDNRNGNSDIFCQSLNSSGTIQWTANGTAATTRTGSQINSQIAGDGAGGALIAWDDFSTYDIWVQALDGSGTQQWSSEGMAIVASASYHITPQIASDDSGGAFIYWTDFRNGSDYDLYGQHVTPDGSKRWTANGEVVASAAGNQMNHALIADGSGGVIAAWQDARTGDSDVYAQTANENLTITAPVESVLLRGDQSQTIAWKMRTTTTYYSYFRIKLSTSPGDGFPTLINGNVNPAVLSYSWTPSTVNSLTAQIRIEAYNDEDVLLCSVGGPVFSVDSNPPAAFALISPAQNAVVELMPTFEWQATTDALSGLDHYDLFIDDVQVEAFIYTTSHTLTLAQQLSEGPHTWKVRALDAAGLVRFTETRNLTAMEDQDPPATFSLSSPANNSWTVDTTPAFSWNGTTDSGTGLMKYQLVVDGLTNQDNIASGTTTISSTTLSAGDRNWYVNAVDSAGNTRKSTETWTIRIDNVPPSTFNLSSPADNSWQNDATPVLSWNGSTDSGIGLEKYILIVDGNTAVDPVASSSASVTLPSAQALDEGTHNWTVIAEDELGNQRTAQSTFTLRIDLTPPNTFNLTNPSGGATVASTSPAFTWQTAPDGGSGLAEYELWIDGARNRDNHQTNSATPTSALSQGTHTWMVKALDNAGNVRSSVEWDVFVDSQPPNTFNLLTPAEGAEIHARRPAFSWQSTTDGGSGFQKYQVIVDGQVAKDNLSQAQTSWTAEADLSVASHTWTVKAFDQAGNVREPTTRNFDITIGPPVFTSSNSATATEDVLFSYTAAATDPDSDPLTFSFDSYPAWMSPSGATISGTSLEGASNTSFNVSVMDGVYTVDMLVSVTVQAVNDPPVITSASSVSATEHQLFTYTATATDPESDPVSFTFSGYPGWMSPSGSQISGTPPESATNTSFTVTASDGSLTDDLIVTVDLNTINDPPVITSATSVGATEHQLFTYSATASDPESNPLTFTYSNYPAWMSPSGSQISGTPPEGATNATFRVTVSDGELTDLETVTVTITPVNDAPVLTSPSSVTATEHQLFTYTANASDPESDPLTFTFSSYPAWMTPSGNQISGTPPESSGNTSFHVEVSDGSLTDDQTVAVTLQSVNDAPTLTSPTTASATEHASFSYTATATDPESNPITFIYDQHPGWLSPSGAVISGTPPEGAANTSFRVTATDGSLSDVQTVTVSVTPVNDAPVMTSASSVGATEHNLFIYTATASDPENDPLTFTFSSYPGWMSPSGSQLSGTPPEGATNTSFQVQVSDGDLTDQITVAVSMQSVNDPPVLTSATSVSATEHTLFTYTATATDPENNPLTFTYSSYPGWMSPSGSQISGTPPEGTTNTSFHINVSDGSLSDDQTVTVNLNLVNDAPELTSATSATATEHALFTYTATATDPESNPLTFTFSSYPAWMNPSNAQITGTPPEGATNTSFQVAVSDGEFSDAQTVTVQITAVNDPPVLTSATSVTATEHALFTYTATATDPESNPLTFSFTGYPAWMTPSASQISGTPPESATNTSFQVTVSDGSLTDQATVQVNMSSINDAPEITSSLSATSIEHELFTYTGTATDPESDPLTFTYDQHPNWLTPADEIIISGTPPEGAQNTSFRLTVSDGDLSDTRTITLSVTPVNDAPVITSPVSANAIEDIEFTYAATATDPEGDQVTFAFENAPAWLTASDDELIGTPENGTPSSSFTVVASDGELERRLHVTLTVQAVNDPPVITSLDTASVSEDTHFSYTATATDIEGDPVSISLDDYPNWLSVNGATISGTPVEGTQDTSFLIIALDGSLEAQVKVQLRVIAVNDAPVITSPDTATATEKSSFRYIASATDIDGPRVSLYFKDYPEWMQPTGGLISGTPPNGSDHVTFKVFALDNHSSDPQIDSLIVNVGIIQVNDPPYFEFDLPQPQWANMDTVNWMLPLDSYVTDPDHPDSLLRWTYDILTEEQAINVGIDSITHKASISLFDAYGEINIVFTVRDPEEASASDTLHINLMISGVESARIGAAPKVFELYENYPNPFNPATTIRYGLPKPSRVRIQIYNVLGRQVATLMNEEMRPGMYEIHWDATGFSSGIYFYKIKAGEWQQVKRMLLLK
ncbi:tandem-95 repeat protein [candidate division KSB1 bacterium]|nr:tandem-95 repeat protein [candidate division KSB1 bacterium]